MSAGPGRRQRALLHALAKPGVEAVWVVPDGINRSEATVWRRAARQLVRRGAARAVYLRRQDRAGRQLRHLALTPPDSDVVGDAYPLRSPGWVTPPPPYLVSFSAHMQALMLEQVTGSPCSARTAARLAHEYRERAV